MKISLLFLLLLCRSVVNIILNSKHCFLLLLYKVAQITTQNIYYLLCLCVQYEKIHNNIAREKCIFSLKKKELDSSTE